MNLAQWMHEVSGWSIAHKDHLTLLATLVSAFAAVAIVALTQTLASENRRLRKAGTEPDVVAYLMPHPVHLIVINLVVANVGRGPARDVEVEFEADATDFSARRVRYPAGRKRRIAAVLPQDERYVQVFGAGEDLYKNGALKEFTIHVWFKDSKGKLRHNRSKASVADFEGYGGFDPPEYEMAAALKKISDNMDVWSSGMKRLKVETLTRSEQTEIDRQLRERFNNSKKPSP
jgi:hypothetical protein